MLRLVHPGRLGLALLSALWLGGCGGAMRRPVEPRREYPAGVTQMRWRTVIHPHQATDVQPEECATPVLVDGRLILGSRAGKVVAVDPNEGQILWSVPVSGGIETQALYHPERNQVYLGSDDGAVYAVAPQDGAIRWSYQGKGAVANHIEKGPDAVYFASAANRVVALDAGNGQRRWQYERERPEGFSIHGHSGPRLAGDVVYAGFDDGYLVALGAKSGDMRWAHSLAAASEQYVDVDTTPVLISDMVIAASYSGGVYALRPKDGEVVWRMGVEGVSALRLGTNRFYIASPRDGLAAVNLQGHIEWRQGFSQAGELTAPQEAGPYLVFSGSRSGLYVIDRSNGQLLQIFDPGRGACAAPLVDAERRELYILLNSGTLYAMSLIW
jgi:outer membrane protein assembly factor BamB